MNATCSICGQVASHSQVAQLGNLRVFRCGTCDGESVVGSRNYLDHHFDYHAFGAGQLARDDLPEYTRRARFILENVLSDAGVHASKAHGSAAFLDYGCGGGHFAIAARELGFLAYGMELDETSIASGQANGIEMIRGSLPSIAGIGGASDRVSSS